MLLLVVLRSASKPRCLSPILESRLQNFSIISPIYSLSVLLLYTHDNYLLLLKTLSKKVFHMFFFCYLYSLYLCKSKRVTFLKELHLPCSYLPLGK